MLHSDALRLLVPVDLGGVFGPALAIEGAALDAAAARAVELLAEAFPSSAYELLERWERTCALAVAPDDPLQLRQNRIMQKMRELGRLDRAYFIALAAGLGYTVVLDELHPFMPGWSGAGDELGDDDSDWCWRAWYSDTGGYYFRAGESAAGECLSNSYVAVLQELFEELKPADTFVEFMEAV
jgi:uncharacterized protein YmfQ (DUF2313 family)